MNINRRHILAGAAASLVARPSIVRAAEPLAVSVVLGNAIHWVQFVAADTGLYKAEGFEPSVQALQSSPQSVQFALTGQYQIATSQPETFVAAIQQGAEQLAAMAAPTNSSDWVLVGARDVKTLADLKGKVVGVSSLRTSESWLTSQLMQQKGFARDAVRFQPAGTSPAKVSSLEAGNIGAAVLFQPSAEVALRAGFPLLARFEGMRDYPTILYIVDKGWAAKGDAGPRASRVIAKAHAWLWDPANRKQAIDILAKYTKRDAALLDTVYEDYFVRGKIYSKTGQVSLDGLQAALNDMAEDGASFKTAPSARKFMLEPQLGGLFA